MSPGNLSSTKQGEPWRLWRN